MSFKTCVLVIVCAIVGVKFVDGGRILGIFPFSAKSHYVMFEPILTELANRGHEVVSISAFPQKAPVKNFKDISASGHVHTLVNDIDINLIHKLPRLTAIKLAFLFFSIDNATQILDIPEVQALLRSDEKFDLIVTELFNTDLHLGFVHRFKAPFVAVSSCALLPWANARFANPDNPAYVPVVFSDYGPKMNLIERTWNAIALATGLFAYRFFYDWQSERLARKHFPEQDLPPLADMALNTSLIMVNTHHSLHGSRPWVPGVIEVGGIHVKPAKELPKELQTYLDESKHGVIYFCMGSMLKASTIPDDKRDALVEVFSKLKQNVLWKWEDDTLPGKPDNVKLVKWMPQRDVLAHPNVKLFISHGGLLGTTEAVYCGVPIIGIPFYGDQGVNIEAVASNGAGLRLDFHDINSETLYKAITEILNNPKYSENAKSLSERFRDRPLSPLETAVYWTEYVIRHKGAPHLRSAAVDLTWYQYLLLDVIAFILAILTSILLVFYYSIKFVIKRFRSSKKDAKEHQEQKVKKQTSQKPKVKKS